MECPQCARALEQGATICLTCERGQDGPHTDGPGRATQGKPPKDPDVAFMLEVLVGIAGVLGAGWAYAGSGRRGVLLIVSWWATLALLVAALVGAARAMGLVGVLAILPVLMTVGVGVPVLSGFRVRRRVRSLHGRAKMSQCH